MFSLSVNELIIPIIMILVGGWLRLHPATYKEGQSNGYSTPRSRASKEAWNMAQELFPKACIKAAVMLLGIIFILNGIYSFFDLSHRTSELYIVELVVIAAIVIQMELKLKKIDSISK